MDYSKYSFLKIEKLDNGIALIKLNRPETLNACDAAGHHEMGQIWLDIDADDEVKVAVITGEGKAFCSGGDLHKADVNDPKLIQHVIKSDMAIVHNMVNMEKPVVSAINGVAVGAGLSVALLSDISIMGEKARLIDGHTKLGVVAGDHSAIIWPLLCGMAKSKYYLLLCEGILGPEAERLGMVSRCVPQEEVLSTAMEIAEKLANGSQWAIRGTKKVLNSWLRMAQPIFDYSAMMEMSSFFLPDAKEGVQAFREKREAKFPNL